MSEKGKKRDESLKGIEALLKGCDLEDIKEVILELSEQFIDLWACVDALVAKNEAFSKEITSRVRTLSAAFYFDSVGNIALKELLIDSGMFTRDALRSKITACTEKKKLIECLGLNFSGYPDIKTTNVDRLSQWLDHDTIERIRGLN